MVIRPTGSAIADATTTLGATFGQWEGVLLLPGVRTVPLSEHAAIEVGRWPGDLAARQVVHEAIAVRGVVVTRRPGAYEGLRVPLLVV